MRQLDAKIAAALGYEVKWWALYEGKDSLPYVVIDDTIVFCEYSTDGNAMLELIAELRRKCFSINHMDTYADRYTVMFQKDGFLFSGKADTMTLAVALAAHKALTGEQYD